MTKPTVEDYEARLDDILPGPISQMVIFDNAYHVSQEVWDGVDREYGAWYTEISRLRVGKPQPHPKPEYSTRELFNNLKAYELIMKGLEICQKIDASIPVEYRDEFARIAPTFLDPFCSFMKEDYLYIHEFAA
ncbi:hypothetical protein POM88_021065 [Heracleum sosnowskyi]|uniref:Uncharacterized protein n=1 Tax=Heracleum sosnowskyi TaxID=360622 RepID=A0AAD8ICX6_9APIA|nr:hypothetical protein POM88_021065 [Heracleum sosnowskyi]